MADGVQAVDDPDCLQYQRTLDRRVTSFLAMTE
jgi:predicted secreted Zn-dependent protease